MDRDRRHDPRFPAPTESRLVPDTVRKVAAEQPHATAVEAPDATLTYQTLVDRAAHLAGYLHSQGVGREELVALSLDRSAALISAMLGTMLAGGAYLPLDPGSPPERLRGIVAESGARILIVDAASEKSFRGLGLPILRLSDEAWPALDSWEPVAVDPDPNDLVYVIYTSGSTGVPKGAEVEHASLAHVGRLHVQEVAMTPADRTLQFAAPGFDAMQLEVWPTLMAGATLVVTEAERRIDPVLLRDFCVERGITTALMTTAMTERMLGLDWPDCAMRVWLTGGEALHTYPPPSLPFKLVNEYGPTECTVKATWGVVSPDPKPDRSPSIGRPLDGVHMHIVDADGREVPGGEPGEMWIAGANVGRGYRHRPDLTAEKFSLDPFCSDGTRLYKSGDIVRWSDRGDLDFLGRIDDQVKVHGHRIEPQEISLTIARYPEVDQVFVQARRANGHEARLVAYIVPAIGARLDSRRLRGRLAEVLPDYMIPTSFVELEALRLTAHGKVDAEALPDPADVADPYDEVTRADAGRSTRPLPATASCRRSPRSWSGPRSNRWDCRASGPMTTSSRWAATRSSPPTSPPGSKRRPEWRSPCARCSSYPLRHC